MKCPECNDVIPEGESRCPVCTRPILGPSLPPPLDEGRFAPGALLANNRFRIAHLLGRGGMGEVYRADDLKLKQRVALKFLFNPLDEDLLNNEVRVAQKIAHPNVCRIHDVVEADDLQFISMEYIDGGTLASLLRRIDRLPQATAIENGQQLCRGLAAAHEKDIVHRDLKPENVMIDGEGQARITDFGLAAAAARIHGADAFAGTLVYMAPEQLAAREATARSDIYALGLVLYEMFTGRRAFEAQTRAELARQQRELAVRSPAEVVPDLDPGIERVILHCLQWNPDERPASAMEVAEALSAAGTVPRTIVACDLTDMEPSWLAEQLGDSGAAELLQRHEELVRNLLGTHQGRKIDETDAHLLIFERPWSAVLFALAYHERLQELRTAGVAPAARIGIYRAEVILQTGSLPRLTPEARRMATQLRSLAGKRQTLVTQGPFNAARSAAKEAADAEGLRWLAHGEYSFQGMTEPVTIFEVGRDGFAPLEAPEDTEIASRIPSQATILGWRPASGIRIPHRRHWVVEEKVGEGGFGEVWLAVHVKTHARLAFKFCYDAQRLRTLQREITVFRLLERELGDRADIVRIIDWNFDEAPYFIESEYTAAGNLAEWAEKQGGVDAVPLEERLEIVAQVATALAAAHSVGVLHKDVKPANVLITGDPEGKVRAQLADFGIGAITEPERLEKAGITDAGLTEEMMSSRTGTRLYMATEHLEGKAPTLQGDIYALGVLLYQMVAGDLSRALGSGWERDVADELLREDIAAAVDRSPEHRLSDARELAKRLRNLESRREERDRERRERQTAQRLRRWLGLAATGMVVASIFAVNLWIQARSIQREKRTVEQVSNFLVDLFRFSAPDEALGERLTARQILDLGARKLEMGHLERQPEVQGRLTHTVGVVYQNLGLYEPATSFLEQSLATRRQVYGDNHIEVAETLDALGNVMRDKNEFDRAEELSRDALAMSRRLLGDEDPRVAKRLEGYASVLAARGKYDIAEGHLREALKIRRHTSARNDTKEARTDVAANLNELALVLQAQDSYEEAEELLREALKIQQDVLGDHPQTAATMHNLAFLLLDFRPDTKESEAVFRRTLEMRQRFYQDNAHPDVAQSLSSLADVLYYKGDYEGAETRYLEALEMQKQIFGESHLTVADTLINLAIVNEGKGNYGATESHYQRALEMQREILGNAHDKVALTMTYYADFLNSRARYEEAGQVYREALAIQQRARGEGSAGEATILNFHGMLLYSIGQYEEAEAKFGRSMEIRIRLFGAEQPDTIEVKINLALTLESRGNYGGAEEMYRETLAVTEATLGESNLLVANSRSNLALLLIKSGEYEEADELLGQARAVVLAQSGNGDSSNVATVLDNMGFLAERQEELASAEEYYLEALDMRRRLFGDIHPDVAKTLNRLARLMVAIGDYRRGTEYIEECLSILRSPGLPQGHWRLKYAEIIRGACLTMRGDYAAAESLLRDGLPVLREITGEESYYVRDTLGHFIRLYEAWGRWEDVAGYRELLEGMISRDSLDG